MKKKKTKKKSPVYNSLRKDGVPTNFSGNIYLGDGVYLTPNGEFTTKE